VLIAWRSRFVSGTERAPAGAETAAATAATRHANKSLESMDP
jgi:hypothetical protein